MAAQLLIGNGLIILAALGVAGFALVQSASLDRQFRQLTTETFNLVLRVAVIDRQGTFIAANAQSLAHQDRYERLNTEYRLRDELSVLDRYLKELSSSPGTADSLESLVRVRHSLVATIDRLVSLLAEQDQLAARGLQREAEAAQLLRQVAVWRGQLPGGGNASGASAAVDEIAHDLVAAERLDHPVLLAQARQRVVEGRAAVDRALAALPPEWNPPAKMTALLATLTEPRDGLVSNRMRLTDLKTGIAIALKETQKQSDLCRAASAALFQATSRDFRQLATRLEDDNRALLQLLVGSLAAMLALAGLVFWFTRFRVIDRLTQLSRVISQGVVGQPNAIPLAGDDEITDLAGAFRHFVITIAAHQAQLTEAHDRAETANKAKSNFLAMMSHEMRTPLTGVIGLADLLLAGGLDDQERRDVGMIRDLAHRLLGLINDLLDLSRIEADRIDVASESLSVVDLVEDVAATMAWSAAAKRIDLRVFVDPHLLDRRRGDTVRLRQVLVNLVANAIKFTETGEVMIEVTPAAFPHSGEADRVRFTVHDTGIGIAEEGQKHLFERFVQADPSVTRRYGGSGLGLAISRRLVMLMHGEIGFTSVPNQGSSFSFVVPLPVETERSRAIAPLSSLMVLQVTESDPSRDDIGRTLSGLGADVRRITSGEAMLAAVTAARDAAMQPAILVVVDGAAPSWVRDVVTVVRAGPLGAPMALSIVHPCFISPEGAASRLATDGPDQVIALVRPVTRRTLEELARSVAERRPLMPAAPPPAHTGASAAFCPPPEEAALADQAVVLVVDDQAINRLVILRLLRRLGFVAHEADSAAAAMARLDLGGIGLVLTDCHMPDVDGYELARRIRAREADVAKRLPIVAVTADVRPEALASCLDAGMDDHLGKPIDQARLEAVVMQYLPSAVQLRRVALPGDPNQSGTTSHREKAIDAQIDWDKLDKDFGHQEGAVEEFVASSVQILAESLQELESAWHAGNYAQALFHAHTMKGIAGNLGVEALGAVLQSLERDCRAGKATDPNYLNQVRTNVQKLVETTGDC